MACLKVLKEEIRTLEATFPRTHLRLQIITASVDELTCRFIDPSGRKHTIHANITVRTSPKILNFGIWWQFDLGFLFLFDRPWPPSDAMKVFCQTFSSVLMTSIYFNPRIRIKDPKWALKESKKSRFSYKKRKCVCISPAPPISLSDF